MTATYPNQLVPERTNAIPCQYKGINFRSLLEARWAYFFDKLGWEWEYEPFEMDGYIPDFVVYTCGKDSSIEFIVDVKPFFSEDYKQTVFLKIKEYSKAMRDAGDWVREVLFVSTPFIKFVDKKHILPSLSYSVQLFTFGELFCTFELQEKMFYLTNSFNEEFCPVYCSFILPSLEVKTQFTKNSVLINDNVVYFYAFTDADGFTENIEIETYKAKIKRLQDYWKEACNATQYKPKTPKQFIESPNN